MDGWPVFALQGYLNAVNGERLLADGSFGPATFAATDRYQGVVGLVGDGIAGPATQSRLVLDRARTVEVKLIGMPDGLLKGKLLAEGGLMLAPVNWKILGGVDCGAAQYRVYGPPYAVREAIEGASMWEAFGPFCVRKAADDFLERRASFLREGAWSKGNPERAGRCAALGHNWPAGALFYSQHGSVSSPNAPATWLPRDRDGNLIVRFPDGVLVTTRQEWAEFYAMGGRHGEGTVTRFVTSWS